jgi:hypothetical protein
MLGIIAVTGHFFCFLRFFATGHWHDLYRAHAYGNYQDQNK